MSPWLTRLVLLCAGLAVGCTALESPRDRARKALERRFEEGISFELGQGDRLQVERLEVLAMDAYADERGGLEGFAQLSIEARVGEIPLSYLGNERLAFRCGASSCSVEGPVAQRLEGVAAALVARRRALAREDAALLASLSADAQPFSGTELREAAARPVTGWFIRVESDSAIVGEADEGGKQRRMKLRLEQDGWRFVAGLP